MKKQGQCHGQKVRRIKGEIRNEGKFRLGCEVWGLLLIALPTATAALRATTDLQPGEQQLQSRL